MAVVSLRLLSFICFFGILISQTTAQPSFNYYFCINDKGNYTANSTYQTNLNTLLSNLSSNTQIDYGFYNFSHGQNSDQVNAIGLCRGDVKPYDCRSCLSDSRVLLTQLCPNQKEAIGWYDNCMLRYSNRSIFGVMEASPAFYMWNNNNATEVDQFNQVLTNLLGGLRSKAASGDSLRKFVAANATGPSFQTIYGLVQCTPDLSEQECTDCLVGAISEIPECCDSKIGGRVVRPSCNIRYENYYFLEPTADAAPPQVSPPPPPSTNSKSTEGKSNTSRTVIAVVVPVVAFVLLLIFICIYLRLRKPRTKFESEAETDNDTKLTDSNQFEFRTIQVATNNFSDANKLGQGGFGPVYKGRLSNGQEVAIKRLSRTSGQGDNEFKNEVLLMAKLQHRNLVRLHGFCLEEKERILLYEFLPNKSLDYFIFDPIKRAQLDWKKRYKIIEGITRGLLYLHEDSQLRIIHRDLKVSNILLDAEMNPKISDFGMAKLFDVDQTQGNTSRIAGTYGYMAPEYAIHGRFSIKSDVFSFGVLVLEIISGKKNRGSCNEENVEHLLSIAWKNWRQGTASRIVDPTLDVGSRNEIMRCIQIGLLCVQEKAVDRPTLASVLLMLEGHYVSLPVPSRPAFFMKNTTLSETDIYSGASFVDAPRNEISITELYPR